MQRLVGTSPAKVVRSIRHELSRIGQTISYAHASLYSDFREEPFCAFCQPLKRNGSGIEVFA